MPSREYLQQIGKEARENGSIVPAPAEPSKPPVPVADYPVSPNPYSRGPLPASYVQQPDTQRGWQSGAVPQTRIPPQPPTANAVAGAQAQSQAIVQIANTPASSGGVTSVGLTVPSQLFVTPVSGSPITSSGTLAVALANEPQNYFFAGPPSSAGFVTFDGINTQINACVAGVASQAFSASVPVTGATDVITYFQVERGNFAATTPTGPWTVVFGFNGSTGGGAIWRTATPGTTTATGTFGNGSGVTQNQFGWLSWMASFQGGVGATVRQSKSVGLNAVGTSTVGFTSNVLAGSTVVLWIGQGSGGGITQVPGITVSDNQGNVYSPQTGNGFIQIQTGGGASAWGSVWTTSGTISGALTLTINIASNPGAGPTCAILEIVNLSPANAIPIFRQIQTSDLPPLNGNEITFGQVALANGGTAANLSGTGGASQVLKQTGIGAAITVGQLANSDLTGYTATSQKNETGADSNVLTFSPPASAGSYRLRFVMSVSAANGATLGWTATWKDSNGNAQTPTNLALFQSGAAPSALTFTTSAAGNYYGYADIDVDNSATNIVIKLTFTGTSVAAKVSATIERLI